MRKQGDIVKIREWQDMEKTYGLTPYGYINCPGIFTFEMKEFCGKFMTISRIGLGDSRIGLGYFCNMIEDSGAWSWHEQMFEGGEPTYPTVSHTPFVEHYMDRIRRELEEEGYINEQPGMYKTYKGPRIGELRMKWGGN